MAAGLISGCLRGGTPVCAVLPPGGEGAVLACEDDPNRHPYLQVHRFKVSGFSQGRGKLKHFLQIPASG